MKRYLWLIALGLGAVLAFALVTLPASVVAGRLERVGVTATAYAGSIWSGSAIGVTWHGAAVGDVQWRLNPAALLGARLAGHARLSRPDGSIDSDFSVTFAGDAELRSTSFALPIDALGSMPLGIPRGWHGRASGRFDEITVQKGWPTRLTGVLEMDGLVAPPPRNADVGSFHVVMPHPKPTGEGSLPGHLTARVTDKNGPFAVDAQLSVARDRSFLLDGTVAPRGAVPESMRHSLELLGPADALGRRPFSVSGTL